MRIAKAVQSLYDEQWNLNVPVSERAKLIFEGQKPAEWFYKARLKNVESFAQKLETGRPPDPARLEDFFACTLVVENRTAIQHAKEFVERFCVIVYQRPEHPETTSKGADTFRFDDLRLYVQFKETGPHDPFVGVTFEVQVKTFLQYAWGIATRDLIYKGDQISWGKARVAFQIKAMLEHAEVSIAEVDSIATSSALSLTDEDTREKNRILGWLSASWEPALLPQDRRRLVDTLLDVVRAMELGVDDMIAAVQEDTLMGGGLELRSLSPYSVVIRALFAHRRNSVHRFLRRPKVRGKLRVLITEEMEVGELPEGALPARYHFLELHPEEEGLAGGLGLVDVAEADLVE